MAAERGLGGRSACAVRTGCHCRVALVAMVAVGLRVATAFGDLPPALSDIQPRGLQIGHTTRVVVTGERLDESAQVILPISGPIEVCVLSADSQRAELQVRVDDAYPPGIYPLRIATTAGLSGPLAIGIDRLPQREYHDSVVALPAALTGRIQGNQVLSCQFLGHVGQRVVVDIEAQRLGSPLRPTLRLYSPMNRLIGIARPAKHLGGDARIDLQLPDEGLYRLELQDIVYNAAAASWFRLKIGDLKYADSVFPLAIPAGVPAQVHLLSSNISDVAWVWPNRESGSGSRPVTWPQTQADCYTGAAPRVHLSELGPNEWTEEDAAQQSDFLRPPLGINGRISAPGERDTYHVHVPPGKKLRFEVHAHRWGSPLDAALLVTREDGQSLGQADDQPGTSDPAVEVDVPADVSQVIVRVSSVVGRGSDAEVYRLSVRPSAPGPPRIQLDRDCLNLPAGSPIVVPLQIDDRGGLRGIRLALPAALDHAISLAPSRLEASDELGLVTFHAAPSARGIFQVALTASTEGLTSDPAVAVRTSTFPGAEYQPGWRDTLAIAVTPPSPLLLAWGADAGPEYLARGTSRTLPVRCEYRGTNTHGSVRLSLLTSQKPPMKEDGGKQVVDESRALRLANTVVLTTDQPAGDVLLLTPPDLPLHPWSLALKAELLAPEDQQVLATAFTSIRRWPAIAPLQVSLNTDSPISVKAGDEAGLTLRGKVERHPDYHFPVQVRIAGLAEGDPQPTATLAGDETDFELTLRFGKESPAREIKDVHVLSDAGRADGCDSRNPQRIKPFDSSSDRRRRIAAICRHLVAQGGARCGSWRSFPEGKSMALRSIARRLRAPFALADIT